MRGHFYIICWASGPAKVLRERSKYEHQQQDARGRLTISGSGDIYIPRKWVVGGAQKFPNEFIIYVHILTCDSVRLKIEWRA